MKHNYNTKKTVRSQNRDTRCTSKRYYKVTVPAAGYIALADEDDMIAQQVVALEFNQNFDIYAILAGGDRVLVQKGGI